MLALLVTFFVSAIAVVTDLRGRRIPNWLTLPALPILLFMHREQPFIALISGLVAVAPFALVYWRGGVGGGDVKLAAVIGVGLGDFDPVTTWLLVTTFAGVAHGLALAARHGRLSETMRRVVRRGTPSEHPLTIPYAPAMFAGVAYITARTFMSW